MLSFHSVVSPLMSLVRTFSTNSRPALRAAACGGRPRAGSHTTVTRGAGLTHMKGGARAATSTPL